MIVKKETKITTEMKSIELTESTEFDVVYAISSLAEEICIKVDYDWSYEEMLGYVLDELMRNGRVSVDGMLKYLGREVK